MSEEDLTAVASKYEAFTRWMRERLAPEMASRCRGDVAASRIACDAAAKGWFAALHWKEQQARVPAASLNITPEMLEQLAAPVPLKALSDAETMRLIRAAMWAYGQAKLQQGQG